MTFNIAILLTADGKGAKAELHSTGKSMDDVTKKLKKMGVATDGLEADLHALAGAERAAANQAVGLAGTHKLAAGQVGNLTAQFNDIGVMMAAGQNPLQLALQQGTQITQVIGPMGAAGAVNALGAAFMQMLNPVTLITIGSIAAGAALVGWLRDAGPEAKTLEDALEELADGLSTYQDAVERALTPTVELEERFGEAASEASHIFEILAQGAKADHLRQIAAAAREMSAAFDVQDKPNQNVLAELFDLSVWNRRSRQNINEVIAALSSLGDAGSVEEQRVAAQELFSAFEEMANARNGVSEEEQQHLNEIGQLILALGEFQAMSINKSRQASEEYYQSRIQSEEYLQNIRAREAAELEKIYGLYGRSRIAANAASAVAAEMLATMQQENIIAQAILDHGEDSVIVARMRADAERAAFEELLASMEAAESQKDELRAAFEYSQLIANANMSGTIGNAADEAARLADNLMAAVGALPGLGLDLGETIFGQGNKQLGDKIFGETTPPVSSGRGGGGASAIDQEREALDKLLAREREALDLLRETDPVQKEMIRNREALKGATDAEREAVEALIAERIAEEQAMESLKAQYNFFANTAYDAISGLIFQGNSLAETMENVGKMILQAALQASLLGTGPLATLLGTSGGGGLLGAIGGALFGTIPALSKGGGILAGPGSGTSDDILMWGSSGEFMMNSKATAQNRHLLEYLNAGNALPGYSAGGLVGAQSAAPHVTQAQNANAARIRLEIMPNKYFDTLLKEVSKDTALVVVESYRRDVAPSDFRRFQSDPRGLGI